MLHRRYIFDFVMSPNLIRSTSIDVFRFFFFVLRFRVLLVSYQIWIFFMSIPHWWRYRTGSLAISFDTRFLRSFTGLVLSAYHFSLKIWIRFRRLEDLFLKLSRPVRTIKTETFYIKIHNSHFFFRWLYICVKVSDEKNHWTAIHWHLVRISENTSNVFCFSDYREEN